MGSGSLAIWTSCERAKSARGAITCAHQYYISMHTFLLGAWSKPWNWKKVAPGVLPGSVAGLSCWTFGSDYPHSWKYTGIIFLFKLSGQFDSWRKISAVKTCQCVQQIMFTFCPELGGQWHQFGWLRLCWRQRCWSPGWLRCCCYLLVLLFVGVVSNCCFLLLLDLCWILLFMFLFIDIVFTWWHVVVETEWQPGSDGNST